MTAGARSERKNRRLALRLRRKGYYRTDRPGRGRKRAGPIESAATASNGVTDAEAKAQLDQLMRLQAEFENFRRRTRKEMGEVRQAAGAKMIETILPVLDNFTRALDTPDASPEGFADGVKMIHAQFVDMLRQTGLEPIEARGETFDPHFHEAVSVDSSGEHPEDEVIDVLQDGYMLNGKLLRPAMVRVARTG